MGELLPFPRKPQHEPDEAERLEALRHEDRRRMAENVAAAVVIVALLWLGFWVIERVSAYSQNVTCLQLKQRTCR